MNLMKYLLILQVLLFAPHKSQAIDPQCNIDFFEEFQRRAACSAPDSGGCFELLNDPNSKLAIALAAGAKKSGALNAYKQKLDKVPAVNLKEPNIQTIKYARIREATANLPVPGYGYRPPDHASGLRIGQFVTMTTVDGKTKYLGTFKGADATHLYFGQEGISPYQYYAVKRTDVSKLQAGGVGASYSDSRRMMGLRPGEVLTYRLSATYYDPQYTGVVVEETERTIKLKGPTGNIYSIQKFGEYSKIWDWHVERNFRPTQGYAKESVPVSDVEKKKATLAQKVGRFGTGPGAAIIAMGILEFAPSVQAAAALRNCNGIKFTDQDVDFLKENLVAPLPGVGGTVDCSRLKVNPEAVSQMDGASPAVCQLLQANLKKMRDEQEKPFEFSPAEMNCQNTDLKVNGQSVGKFVQQSDETGYFEIASTTIGNQQAFIRVPIQKGASYEFNAIDLPCYRRFTNKEGKETEVRSPTCDGNQHVMGRSSTNPLDLTIRDLPNRTRLFHYPEGLCTGQVSTGQQQLCGFQKNSSSIRQAMLLFSGACLKGIDQPGGTGRAPIVH